MLAHIERWRGKSREARSRLAFVVAASITGVILVIWLFSLPARFASVGENTALLLEGAQGEGTQERKDSATSLQGLLQNAEIFGGITAPSPTSTNAAIEPSAEPETTLDPVIPRRVLIATTTREKVE